MGSDAESLFLCLLYSLSPLAGRHGFLGYRKFSLFYASLTREIHLGGVLIFFSAFGMDSGLPQPRAPPNLLARLSLVPSTMRRVHSRRERNLMLPISGERFRAQSCWTRSKSEDIRLLSRRLVWMIETRKARFCVCSPTSRIRYSFRIRYRERSTFYGFWVYGFDRSRTASQLYYCARGGR